MGCNCKKTQGFNDKLRLAQAETKRTGETHVVFIMEAVKQIFVCKEDDLTDDMGVCCYFLPDGTEVAYTTDKVTEIIEEIKARKRAKTIEVIDPIIEQPTKKTV
jgi:hypothetical protein